MSNLSKNDVRVIILNNKIEEMATKIESIVTQIQCDVVLDRLFTITRPLRQNTGVCRVAYMRIKAFIESITVEKFIMENVGTV